jgi:hypothetical protein
MFGESGVRVPTIWLGRGLRRDNTGRFEHKISVDLHQCRKKGTFYFSIGDPDVSSLNIWGA